MYLIRENTFMIYGLYPVQPASLEMVLWYLHPFADEYFAKNKILLTNEGVVIYQQGYQLNITTPPAMAMGECMSIVLPKSQGKNSSWGSGLESLSQLRTPRHIETGGPTRIWTMDSAKDGDGMSTVIKCLTEHDRAHFAIDLAKALYYLSQRVAVYANGVVETHLINI